MHPTNIGFLYFIAQPKAIFNAELMFVEGFIIPTLRSELKVTALTCHYTTYEIIHLFKP